MPGDDTSCEPSEPDKLNIDQRSIEPEKVVKPANNITKKAVKLSDQDLRNNYPHGASHCILPRLHIRIIYILDFIKNGHREQYSHSKGYEI